jgi:hypothetical protein
MPRPGHDDHADDEHHHDDHADDKEQPVSQPRNREPAAEDADPTGVRALLSSLPDPGPMPSDLAERITARLRQEQEVRARGEVVGATVTPLADRRARRSPHHWLAAAAAVAAVAVGGTLVVQSVLGDRGWDSVAAFYTGDAREEAGSDAADDAGAAGSDGGSESGEELAREGDSDVQAPGSVEVMPGSAVLTRETLAVGAAAAVESATAASGAVQEEAGALLTTEQAHACVRALGSDPADGSWMVGPAAFDGDPAVLVVATGESPARAWAVAPGCVDGDAAAEALHGPVALP